MRIIGGTLGGRRFPGPPSHLTRPTSDRVREAVASALDSRGYFDEARVLDLFTGTGALAFEALSRGAASAVLVEGDRRVAKAARESATQLGLAGRARVLELDLLATPATVVGKLGPGPFDLVFADPPYAAAERLGPLLRALVAAGVVPEGGLFVVEFATKSRPTWLGQFASVAEYKYGDTSVALLSATGEPPP